MKTGSFSFRLFASVGGVLLAMAACFAIFQDHRERAYKIDVLQGRLQTYNFELLQTLGDSVASPRCFDAYARSHPLEGLRATLIEKGGRVLADSREGDVKRMSNHAARTEIAQALRHGSGFDLKRSSETLGETYFYSATYFKDRGLIVRSAVPYDAPLAASLEPDRRGLWFLAALTLLLGGVLYWNTRRVGRHVEYLRNFAARAESGEPVSTADAAELPNDELGEISRTITVLYQRLSRSEQEKRQLKQQLTRDAAHELKTPAAAIQGYLEILSKNPALPEAQRTDFLQRAEAQSRRLTALLNDMATLSQLDAARTFDLGEEFSVQACAEKIVEEFAPLFAEKNIEIETQFPPDTTIRGNRALVETIFRNLLANALAYGSGASRLRLEGSASAATVRFSVSDNGVGVPAESLDRLFDRFYRVDKGRSRAMGGTGLGLAIVKNAAALHGGSVHASETPGGGLTIEFSLARGYSK